MTRRSKPQGLLKLSTQPVYHAAMHPRDFKLHRNQTALMQSLLLVMPRGFRWWTSGTLSPLKVEPFLVKMHAQFGVLDSPMRRSRRKLRGGTGVQIFLHPTADGSRFNFWLVATAELAGQGMQDGWDVEGPNRLKLEDKYMLAQTPKPKEGTTWTWKMQKEYARDWEFRMIDLARRDQPKQMSDAIRALEAMPRWNGIRNNVWKILEKGKRIWEAEHKNHPDLLRSVYFPKTKELRPITRISAFADPPLTVGIWLDAYTTRLDSIDLTASEESPTATLRRARPPGEADGVISA
jgi:hypothetical protein